MTASERVRLTEQETERRGVFVVTLRALPGIEPIRALRALLKTALRRDGLECLDVRRVGEVRR
jgi:hypothetical protein